MPSPLPKPARLLIACHCRLALSCWAPSLPPRLASYSLLKKHIYLILCPSLCSPHAYSHGQTSTSLQAGGGGGRGGSAEGKLRCVHGVISLSTTFGQLLLAQQKDSRGIGTLPKTWQLRRQCAVPAANATASDLPGPEWPSRVSPGLPL